MDVVIISLFFLTALSVSCLSSMSSNMIRSGRAQSIFWPRTALFSPTASTVNPLAVVTIERFHERLPFLPIYGSAIQGHTAATSALSIMLVMVATCLSA